MAFPLLAMLFLLLLDQVVGDAVEYVADADEPYELDGAYADLVDSDLLQDFGYGTDVMEYAGYGTDSQYYYSDEFDEYYNQYGIYADEFGYDYFDTDSGGEQDCKEDDAGKASMTEDVCDVKVSGVDAHLTKDLPGGLDGLYKLDGCFGGQPKFKRAGKSENDTRILWKSSVFNDWDISVGDTVNMANAVLYGIGSGLETRPNFLKQQHWRLVSSIAKEKPEEGEEHVHVNVTVKCDGKKQLTEPDRKNEIVRPLLTDEEAEANYRAVYTRYQKAADPSINFVLVFLMVALGAAVVLGISRLMKRKREDGRTLAQVIEDSRKQRQGHTL